MFFAKKPTIIYLQKGACILYTNKSLDGDTFTFPKEEDEFCEKFKTFLIQNSLSSSNAILILSSDLFTQKELTKKEVEDQKKEVEEFIKSTKISEENLNKETFELNNVMYIMAVNKSSYTSFIKDLETVGFSISSVIPISLFRDIQDTKIKKNGVSTKELKEILRNQKLIKEANIFKKEIDASVDTSNKSTSSPKKSYLSLTYIGIAGCLVVIVASIIFLIQSGAVSQAKNSLFPKPTPTATPVPSPTPMPANFEEDKSKLTVKILNGTGVTGQAGKVKSEMTKLDYTDIQTGNADSQENTETLVTVSSKVSPEYADEIVKSLETVFKLVSKKSGDGDFDITILTGTEK